MAAEAGECNGRCGDLKEEEEVGGSYVIVNGSSGSNSEEDLDLDLAPDHSETKSGEIHDVDFDNVGGGENGVSAVTERSEKAGVEEVEEKHDDGGGGGTELGSRQPEPEVAAAETAGGGRSELPVKDVKESELSIDSTAEIEVVPRSQLGDPVDGSVPDANLEVEENRDGGSGTKLEQEPEPDVVVEMEGPREYEAPVEVEDVKEPEAVIVAEPVEAVVEETANAEADSAAEDDKAEAEERNRDAVLEEAVSAEINISKSASSAEVESKVESVIEETGNGELELSTGVKVDTRQLPVDEDDKGEAEEMKESFSVAEETEIGVVESAAEVESRVDIEEVKDPEHVIEETCNAVVERDVELKVESSQPPEDPVVEDEKVEAEEIKKSCPVLEEAMAEETNIVESEPAAEVKLKIEAENRNEPESVIEESDSLCEKSELELVGSEDDDKVDAEEKREPEASGEALQSAAAVESTEAGVTESTLSECIPIGNGVEEMQNVEADAPTDEQPIQLETEASSVSGDVGVSTDVNEPKSGECSESPEKLAKEVTRCIDIKCLEFGLFSHSEIVTSPQLGESISSGPVPMAAEQKTTELCPTNASEVETGMSVKLVATDKGVADHAGGMQPEFDNSIESIESGKCKASSTEEHPSTKKDDDEESSHEQIAAAEAIQDPSAAHIVKRHPVYLIKVPRFTDGELDRKIQQVVMDVNVKTQFRDSIQEDIRNKLVNLGQLEQELKDASAKENAERDVLNAKYEEIEGVQLLINRINNVTSIADIDEKIQNMAHRQQHETIDLKQEKLFIREINQLKKLREQLSNTTTQEQIDETLGQSSEVYARLEKLRKELKPLRENLNSAVKCRNEVRQRVLGERSIIMSLKEQYRVANVIRQEAYKHLQELRKQSAEKFKHFSVYKADQNVATNFRFSGDNEGLLSHCSRQVERVMELWNGNEEFRKEYVKSNAHSTLRRLGTLDGRSLGPGEEAPDVSSHVDKKPKSFSLPSSNVETSAPLVSGGKPEKSEALATKQVTRTSHLSQVKSSAKPVIKEVMPAISIDLKSQKKDEKEPKPEELKKEEELATKEEELRKEKAAKEEELRKEKAAKEEVRLEQKAKAKEAEERKKRKVEKARAKADRKTQKEAELKEKKKTKKEMKKSYGEEAGNGNVEGQTTPITSTDLSETSAPHEAKTTVASTSKRRTSRSAVASKQYDRVKPLPLPLRNRGKRKMTTWMWAILAALLVLLLFFAGNYISVSSFGTMGFKF